MATLPGGWNEIHTTNKFFQTAPYNNIESKTANYREQLKQVQANADFQKEKMDAEWLKEKASNEQSEYLFTLYNNIMDKMKQKQSINNIRQTPGMNEKATQTVNRNNEISIQATPVPTTPTGPRPTDPSPRPVRANGPVSLTDILNARNTLSPTRTRTPEEAPRSNDSNRARAADQIREALNNRRTGRRNSPDQLSPFSLSGVVSPTTGNTPNQLSPVGSPPTRRSISQANRRQIEEVMRNAGVPRGVVAPAPGSAMIDAVPSMESGNGMRKKKKGMRGGNILI